MAFVFTAISFGCLIAVVSMNMKSLGAYKIAVKRAETDSRVIAAIGTPLKEGWLIRGRFNVNGASGNAELAIPLLGPRAKGTIYAAATESVGEWRFSNLIFQLDSSGEESTSKTRTSRGSNDAANSESVRSRLSCVSLGRKRTP